MTKMRIFATPIVRVRLLVIPLSSNTILESIGTFSLRDSFLIRFISDPVSIIKLARSSIKSLLGKITDGGFPIFSQATFTLAYPLVIRSASLGARAGVRSALCLSAEPDRGFSNSLELFLVGFRQLYFLY